MALRIVLSLGLIATARADSCDAFQEALKLMVQGACAGATSCDAPQFEAGSACRAAASALTHRAGAPREASVAECLEESAHGLDAAVVEAVLACPEKLEADEQALAEARGEDVDPSDAMAFDGDCSAFKAAAEKVYATCAAASCCADVVADETCREDAAGLHALYRPRRPRLIRSRSRRRRGRDADRPWMGRGDAAATTQIVRGWVAAAPRPRRGSSVDGSRRRRGRDADRPWMGRGGAAATTWMVRGDASGAGTRAAP